MKITIREEKDDPAHPIMHGNTPAANEFNERMEGLWDSGVTNFDYVLISTILLEILIEDYNRRNKTDEEVKTKTKTKSNRKKK